MQVQAHAKLNLTLDILGKRSDGYHDLRMVMQSVSLCDDLTVEVGTGGGMRVNTDRAYLPNDERNLAAAAAARFIEATGLDPGGVSIGIRKSIPVCAGLAGGSSDAAAVLRALNELTGARLTRLELAQLGAAVGSDVPYCVLGGTALCESRGEVLTPLKALTQCCVVLCKPAFPVATPELFARADSVKLCRHPDTAGLIAALEAGELEGVARRLYNVFEDVLPARKAAEVNEIKSTLLSHGALGASMSGSGPTVFGLFQQEERAREAYEELVGTYRETFITEVV